MQQVAQADFHRRLDMTEYAQPEGINVDLGGDVGQVPADIKGVVGSKDPVVEDRHRSLEQRRTGAEQYQGALLRKTLQDADSVGKRHPHQVCGEGGRAGAGGRAEHAHQPKHLEERAPRQQRFIHLNAQ